MAEFSLRPASEDDSRLLFGWRNTPEIVAFSSAKRTVGWDEHLAWFESCLASPDERRIFIVQRGGRSAEDIGMIRFDRIDRAAAAISVYLIPGHTGRGIGTAAIAEASRTIAQLWTGLKRITAHVLDENTQGQRSFEKAGYRRDGDGDQVGHITFAWPSELIARPKEGTGAAERIAALYRDSLAVAKAPHEGVRWGSAQSQARRFEVLCEIGDLSGCSVLDLGSGLGSFYEFIRKRWPDARYTGLDITPEMVAAARSRYPDADFCLGSIDTIQPDQSYDYVFASGIFTYCFGEPKDILHETVAAMFQRARRGIAFNCLSSWGDRGEARESRFDPAATLDALKDISRHLVLRHDYMPHDFTVYLRRSP